MKKLLIIPLLFLFIGCSSDPVEESIDDSIDRNEGATKNSDGEKNNKNTEGQSFGVDSATRFAVLQYNKLKICEYGGQLIENILKKNKILEFSNKLGDEYGYTSSKDIKDSLVYYGYADSDISFTNQNKEIYLSGRDIYTAKGIWEKAEVNIQNIETKFPKLYKRAITLFYQRDNPKVQEVNIADQAGNTIDYCARIGFNDGQEEYICFTVQTANQKTVVTLKKN